MVLRIHSSLEFLANKLEQLSLMMQADQQKLDKVEKVQAQQVKFYNAIIRQAFFYQKNSLEILQSQKFSQQMMENLINDLLDLAKLENSSFALSKSYFNLSYIIYQAFQIL